jgi:hypothetical protein
VTPDHFRIAARRREGIHPLAEFNSGADMSNGLNEAAGRRLLSGGVVRTHYGF